MAQLKVVTAHIPEELAKKVDDWSARLERSRGWIVKQALAAWIDQEEERHQLTLEALSDVDAGRLVEHQTVQSWTKSLTSRKAGKPRPKR